MSKGERAMLVLWVSTLIGICVIIMYAKNADEKFANECKDKGGAVLQSRGLQVCVDPKILK